MAIQIPTAKELLKAGLHFGHKTSKWNPKMAPYIYGVKNGIHIFDLEKTQQTLEVALKAVEDTVARGGVLLFLGTKKQARKIIEKYAQEVDMPYVVERWIGGMITNFAEINKLVKKLEQLEKRSQEEDYERKYTKKERLLFKDEMDNLRKNIGGIRNLKKIPDLVYVVGVRDEKTAIKELKAKGVKSVGVVDSNANPDKVTYPIAANDDAIKSIELITSLVAEAVKSGVKKVKAAEVDKATDDKNND